MKFHSWRLYPTSALLKWKTFGSLPLKIWRRTSESCHSWSLWPVRPSKVQPRLEMHMRRLGVSFRTLNCHWNHTVDTGLWLCKHSQICNSFKMFSVEHIVRTNQMLISSMQQTQCFNCRHCNQRLHGYPDSWLSFVCHMCFWALFEGHSSKDRTLVPGSSDYDWSSCQLRPQLAYLKDNQTRCESIKVSLIGVQCFKLDANT